MLLEFWHKLEGRERRVWVQVETTEHSSELLSAMTTDDSDGVPVSKDEFTRYDLRVIEETAVERYEESKREKKYEREDF